MPLFVRYYLVFIDLTTFMFNDDGDRLNHFLLRFLLLANPLHKRILDPYQSIEEFALKVFILLFI